MKFQVLKCHPLSTLSQAVCPTDCTYHCAHLTLQSCLFSCSLLRPNVQVVHGWRVSLHCRVQVSDTTCLHALMASISHRPVVVRPQLAVSTLQRVLQIIKLAVTVYYGSRYQCEKVPQHFAIRAAQNNKVHLGLAREGNIAALKAQKATYQRNE